MPTIEKKVISFENTENAFKYKSDKDLKQANFLFSSMGFQWLVKLGTRLTPWAIKSGLPIKGVIRSTIFKQFVGGETLEETKPVVDMLGRYNVKVILDYGVEGGDEGDEEFDHAMEEFKKVVDYAGSQTNIPVMSIKLTGMARFGLLEKLDDLMHQTTNTLMKRYEWALSKLSEAERAEWQRVHDRLDVICKEGLLTGIGVSIDAEETWIQDPVDALTILMMNKYNHEKVAVYNTVQLYRHDRLAFLRAMLEAAKERGFVLGVKLVRGAYMERERRRAEANGYPSPIQKDKASTDADFNEAVQLCIDHLDQVSVIVASHNEYSNKLAADLLMKKGLPLDHPHVHFSQLFGMSDNITFNLAAAGCNVSKYLPFGPIEDVIPYLMRRAQENSSVGGQTGRELLLIRKELKRRGL
ncbi:MAG: proline dehydrogenase family protein [Chitinophagaceae bacterium]|nr:proline dehydrogenase family protein [Chitinophagaceae bacterium]